MFLHFFTGLILSKIKCQLSRSWLTQNFYRHHDITKKDESEKDSLPDLQETDKTLISDEKQVTLKLQGRCGSTEENKKKTDTMEVVGVFTAAKITEKQATTTHVDENSAKLEKDDLNTNSDTGPELPTDSLNESAANPARPRPETSKSHEGADWASKPDPNDENKKQYADAAKMLPKASTTARRMPRKPGVKAIPKLKYANVFASRFSPDVQKKDLKVYLKSATGLDADVKRLDTRSTTHNSFHITCECEEPTVFMKEDIWPFGCYVRWWRKNSEDAKKQDGNKSVKQDA